MTKPHRNNQQRTLDQIIGNPPLITVPSMPEPDCLYQAFINAVTILEQDDLPSVFLDNAITELTRRVSISKQRNAKICLKAFNKHYTKKLSPSTNGDKPSKTKSNLELLAEDAKKSLLEFKKNTTAETTDLAIADYDVLINYVMKQDTDEVHNLLEKFKEDNVDDITALLKASKQDRRPQGSSGSQPLPPGRK